MILTKLLYFVAGLVESFYKFVRLIIHYFVFIDKMQLQKVEKSSSKTVDNHGT